MLFLNIIQEENYYLHLLGYVMLLRECRYSSTNNFSIYLPRILYSSFYIGANIGNGICFFIIYDLRNFRRNERNLTSGLYICTSYLRNVYILCYKTILFG